MMTDSQLEKMAALGGDLAALVAEVRALREGAVTSPSVPPASPLRAGNNVFIRTVTTYHVGRVEVVTDTEILLSKASWVADTGRFSTALATGKLNEVEPFINAVSVARAAVVDVTDWVHKLPEAQK